MAARRKLQPGLPKDIPTQHEVQAWVGIAHAYHRIARALETALDEDGLTLSQFEVLARLHFDGTMSQSTLARRLLVTKGNVCGLLDRMAAAKWVERRTDQNDRRVNNLTLTAKGRSVLARSFPRHIAIIQRQMAGLDEQQLKSIQTALARFAPSDSKGRCGQ